MTHASVGILWGLGEYSSIWEFSPLELHCDKLVGSHYWLWTFPPVPEIPKYKTQGQIQHQTHLTWGTHHDKRMDTNMSNPYIKPIQMHGYKRNVKQVSNLPRKRTPACFLWFEELGVSVFLEMKILGSIYFSRIQFFFYIFSFDL